MFVVQHMAWRRGVKVELGVKHREKETPFYSIKSMLSFLTCRNIQNVVFLVFSSVSKRDKLSASDSAALKPNAAKSKQKTTTTKKGLKVPEMLSVKLNV